MTGERHIDYEALAQDALRKIVRAVLVRVAKSGLPGEHHFYISFSTSAPGVSISPRLREKYPDEMTIVLQHRFWDLKVSDDRFEVKLTFDAVPETLVIPFAAIKVFFDPSVPYGLQFEGSDLAEHGVETGAEGAQDVASSFGSALGARPTCRLRRAARRRQRHRASRAPRCRAPKSRRPSREPCPRPPETAAPTVRGRGPSWWPPRPGNQKLQPTTPRWCSWTSSGRNRRGCPRCSTRALSSSAQT